MSTPRSVYRRLPKEDKRTIVVYGWMTMLTIGLVLLFLFGQQHQSAEIQAQRRVTLARVCQVQNAKHRKLYEQMHRQRRATGALPMGPKRREQELQTNSREELIETLEPWLDCTARVKQFAP